MLEVRAFPHECTCPKFNAPVHSYIRRQRRSLPLSLSPSSSSSSSSSPSPTPTPTPTSPMPPTVKNGVARLLARLAAARGRSRGPGVALGEDSGLPEEGEPISLLRWDHEDPGLALCQPSAAPAPTPTSTSTWTWTWTWTSSSSPPRRHLAAATKRVGAALSRPFKK